jgi:hypothetical protein
MPQDNTQSRPPGRRMHVLVFRLGILGAFIAAFGVSLASFALFGCFCPPTLPPHEWDKQQKSNDSPVAPGSADEMPTTAIPAK